ncbi:MAG: outer membrane lipoprotein carrier protein LolA [Gemmatimonadota bacterium]
MPEAAGTADGRAGYWPGRGSPHGPEAGGTEVQVHRIAMTGPGGARMRRNGQRIGPLLACAAVWSVAPRLAAQTTASGPGDIESVLERAERVYRSLESLRATFDQTIEVPLLGRSRSGTGTWYQKGRGRFKMDFRDPEGDLIVADGSHLWLYYPSTHPGQVIRSGIDANVTGSGMVDLQGRIFEEAHDGYVAEDGGVEDVAGTRTRLIVLTPTGASPYERVRVWVGVESSLVRKFEIRERNETVRTVILRDLEPNAAIPDSVFRFTPPADADVFEG